MFLFTTPASGATAPASPAVAAIREGARDTGVDFGYLLAAAQRESALDPSARARTSSATGLFQFIEQTWLGLVRSEGARLGLAEAARAVERRPDGTYAVADEGARREILALREDPRIAAQLAGAFTLQNREALEAELGRAPSEADLAVAHVLGARGAAALIRAASERPETSAAALFPRAAEANRALFHHADGRARSVGELYAAIAGAHRAARDAAPAFGEDAPLAFARADGPAFHGLFRTDLAAGPVSAAVASLWSAPADAPAAPGASAPRAGAPARSGPLDLSAFMRTRP